MQPHKGPWSHLWRTQRSMMARFERASGWTLTLLLLGIGLVLVWIALRGSNRVKAATAVWTLFP